jgi:hypothetical protein
MADLVPAIPLMRATGMRGTSPRMTRLSFFSHADYAESHTSVNFGVAGRPSW